MPKLKLKFDRKAVAGFFVSHVEKVVLIVVLLLFVTFVYTGYSLESLDSDKSPQDLAEKSRQARQHIQTDNWEAIFAEIRTGEEHEKYNPVTGLEERVRKAQENPTRAVVYAATKPLVPETKASGLKRADPELLAPYDVEADVVVGPLAVKPVGDEMDMLAQLEDTEMKIKKKKRKRSRRRGGKMTQEELDRSFGVEEEDTSVDPFAQVSGGGPDIFGEDEDGKTPATAADRTFPGYRPEDEAAPMSFAMVAVKALVPVQKQWNIYDQTLANAMHYNRGRDIPRYLAFEAERAEVGDDPNAPLNWEYAGSTGEVHKGLSRIAWTGLAGEIADSRYVNSMLTMPVPPIMMRPYEEFALHSEIPRVLKSAPKLKDYLEEEEQAPQIFSLGADREGPAVAVPLTTATTTPKPKAGSGQFGGFGMDQSSGGSSDYTAPKSTAGPAADQVLVRFFDFRAKLGKTYRYRVRVYLEDPNYPVEAALRPAERALDEEVKKRLAAAGPEYPGYRKTDWSDPSEPVKVDLPRKTIAGPIKDLREVPVAQGSPMEVPVIEPSANVLSIVYDFDHAADVPAFSESYRGSYFDFVQDADVVHPVSLAFKKLEDYRVNTGHMLVDFAGGEVLPKIEVDRGEDEEDDKKSDDEEVVIPDLRAMTEYMFLDVDGNFFVRSDLEDQEIYDRYVVPEKEEE